MINLVGQQLTKTLIYIGNPDNIVDFCNFEGLGWSIFVFLYIMKLLFCHLIEKIEDLDVEVFWSLS